MYQDSAACPLQVWGSLKQNQTHFNLCSQICNHQIFHSLIVWHDGSSHNRVCWWVPHLQKTQRTLHSGCMHCVFPSRTALRHPRWSLRAQPVWLPVWWCFSSILGFLWNRYLSLDLRHGQILSRYREDDWSPSWNVVVVLLEVLRTCHHGWNLLVQCFPVVWCLLQWLQVPTVGRVPWMGDCFVVHAVHSWSRCLAVIPYTWDLYGGRWCALHNTTSDFHCEFMAIWLQFRVVGTECMRCKNKTSQTSLGGSLKAAVM